MVDEAGGAGPVGDFGVGDGGLAGRDGVEPVAVLVVADIQMGFVGADDGFDDGGIAGVERFYSAGIREGVAGRDAVVTPRDKDPSLCAFKFYSVW